MKSIFQIRPLAISSLLVLACLCLSVPGVRAQDEEEDELSKIEAIEDPAKRMALIYKLMNDALGGESAPKYFDLYDLALDELLHEDEKLLEKLATIHQAVAYDAKTHTAVMIEGREAGRFFFAYSIQEAEAGTEDMTAPENIRHQSIALKDGVVTMTYLALPGHEKALKQEGHELGSVYQYSFKLKDYSDDKVDLKEECKKGVLIGPNPAKPAGAGK